MDVSGGVEAGLRFLGAVSGRRFLKQPGTSPEAREVCSYMACRSTTTESFLRRSMLLPLRVCGVRRRNTSILTFWSWWLSEIASGSSPKWKNSAWVRCKSFREA